MPLTPLQRQRNVVAAQAKHHPGSPQHEDARRELAALNLENYIRRTVEQAPALTPEQRWRLAAMLSPYAVSP